MVLDVLPVRLKIKCSDCDGQGQVRVSRNMGFSTFVTVQPCREMQWARNDDRKAM